MTSFLIKLEIPYGDYLTIRLRARDFYEVIVDEGEARINYHLIEIGASNLIVLVESAIKHKYCTKTLKNASWKRLFLKKIRQENDCLLLAIYEE